MSIDHDAFAVANSARDDGEPAGRALHGHCSLPRRVSLIDHVHVGPALAGHDRLRRHDERAVLVEQMQRGRRELPSPQPAVRVVEHRLELYRARRRIDRVVDERQLAGEALARDAALLYRAGRRVGRATRLVRDRLRAPTASACAARATRRAGVLARRILHRVHGRRGERVDRRRRRREAARHRRDGKPAARTVLQHYAELRRRNGEPHEDRPNLVDHHERRRAARAHQVAALHQQTARLSGDRRADDRVVEVELCLRHGGPIGPKRRLGGRGDGELLIAFLRRDHLGVEQLFVPLGVGLRVHPVCAVTGEHGQRLLVGVPVRSRVDVKECLALLNVLTFLEVDGLDDAIDLGSHRDALHWGHDPIRLDDVGHRGAPGGHDADHRDRPRRPILLLAAGSQRQGKAQRSGEIRQRCAIGEAHCEIVRGASQHAAGADGLGYAANGRSSMIRI